MMRIKDKLGWILVAVLTLLPVLIWIFLKPIDSRFISISATLTSFGQVAGLAGMALFSLNLFLSSRLRFLEDYFGGLNRVYIAHHIFGGIAFSLLLFHPLLLAGKYILFSVRSAAIFLLPGSDLAINFGIAALDSLTILLILTFFVKLPYQIWRFSHKFLGFAFFMASLHVFFIRSDVSESLALKTYMLGLAAISLAAFSYRTIFFKILVKRFKYTVEKVNLLASNVAEITLKPKDNAMQFTAGQFLFISFHNKKVGAEVHPFTISSDASEKSLRLTIKSLGDFTTKIPGLKVGDAVDIEGPFGKFSYQNFENKNQIWIAGGIGITPFLSMARRLRAAKNDSDYKVDLYYCAKNQNEAVLVGELLEIASQNKSFRVIPFYSDEKGFISAEAVKNLSSGIVGKEIFLCGPPVMMRSLRKQFLKIKVPSQFIHSEEFQL